MVTPILTRHIKLCTTEAMSRKSSSYFCSAAEKQASESTAGEWEAEEEGDFSAF